MFSIGLPEIALIFLVLVLLIKPEDIPKVFQTLGRWYGNLKRLYIGVTDEFREISYQLDMTTSLNAKKTDPTQKNDDPPQLKEEECEPVSFGGSLNKR